MRGATGEFDVDEDLMPSVLDARVVHLGGSGLMDAMDGGRNAELARRAQAGFESFDGTWDSMLRTPHRARRAG